uniref:DUF4371 domain-containing protein n=1 Tax=Latimeria chalumnae TaxID=7897 RepID=H3BBC0_LATCH
KKKKKIYIYIYIYIYICIFKHIRKPMCLLCQASLGQFKSSNFQQHFNTNHGWINNNFPIGSEVHAFKVKTLKSEFEKQVQAFSKFAKESENVTLASYQVAWNIAHAKKPYSEGDFVKTCLTDVAAILCPDNNSLQKQISDLSSDTELQLHSDIQTCAYLSIAIDESCDIQDKPQLAVFVCTVSDDCKIKELLDVVAVKERTCGVDINQALMLVIEKAKLPLQKLTAIATDGAPAMLGAVSGLVGLCKADKSFSKFWTFHCIVHREQLVSKHLNTENVMSTVLEIANYFRMHALNHRQFKSLLAELNEKELPGDLALRYVVHWLSRGKIISHFFELLNPMRMLLKEKGKLHPKLTDPQWVLDLAFLADMLSHLDRLNLDLQGKMKMLPEFTQSVFAFINKLKLFRAQMEKAYQESVS